MEDFQADICPVCGHAGLDYEIRDVQEDVLVYPWTCPQCKSKGDEEYTISFNTHVIHSRGRENNENET
ncbi:MAG: hypothetical protein LBC86_07370 [Oscillospiraceae bacterium]|jgi:hypothetical protein|nr:hypothetical protein [Oscillospiraceae bacterium]